MNMNCLVWLVMWNLISCDREVLLLILSAALKTCWKKLAKLATSVISKSECIVILFLPFSTVHKSQFLPCLYAVSQSVLSECVCVCVCSLFCSCFYYMTVLWIYRRFSLFCCIFFYHMTIIWMYVISCNPGRPSCMAKTSTLDITGKAFKQFFFRTCLAFRHHCQADRHILM